MFKRVDIKTGFLCNNNCRFCVQADNKPLGNRAAIEIKKDLDAAIKTGCSGVVFTGGEVSIRDDFFELLRYAKGLGFEAIQVQTNGRRFYYMDFCERAVDAGMNEFALALHGHIPELHDWLTRSPGSFKQTTQGIRNVHRLGVRILSNSVMVKPNFRHAPEIARLLVELGVDMYQLAFVHPICNAGRDFDQMVPWMSLAAPYIHEGLQLGIDAGVKVMAEAMPYCLMKGYERYVSEMFIPETEIRGLKNYVPQHSKSRRQDDKIKFPQCKECKYELICEGPWKEYPEKRGNDEFRPVKGEKIKDIKGILYD